MSDGGTSLALARALRQQVKTITISDYPTAIVTFSKFPAPDRSFNFEPISDSIDKLMRDRRAFVNLELILPQNYDLDVSFDVDSVLSNIA